MTTRGRDLDTDRLYRRGNFSLGGERDAKAGADEPAQASYFVRFDDDLRTESCFLPQFFERQSQIMSRLQRYERLVGDLRKVNAVATRQSVLGRNQHEQLVVE